MDDAISGRTVHFLQLSSRTLRRSLDSQEDPVKQDQYETMVTFPIVKLLLDSKLEKWLHFKYELRERG